MLSEVWDFLVRHQLLSGSVGAIAAAVVGVVLTKKANRNSATQQNSQPHLNQLNANPLAVQAYLTQKKKLEGLNKKLMLSEFQKEQLLNNHFNIISELTAQQTYQSDNNHTLEAIAADNVSSAHSLLLKNFNPEQSNNPDDAASANMWRQLGSLYLCGDFEQSLNMYLKSLEFQPNDVEALSQVAFIYQQLGRLSQAIDYYLKVISQVGSPLEDQVLLNCYKGLGDCYKKQQETEAALEYFEKALNIALKLKLNHSAIYLLIQLIRLTQKNSDWQACTTHYELLLQMVQAGNSPKFYRQTALRLGNIYRLIGCPFDAKRVYFTANHQLITAGKEGFTPPIYTQIGHLYLTAGFYDQALTAFQKSLAIHKGQKRYTETLKDYDNIAQVYKEKGTPEKSLAALNKGAAIVSKNTPAFVEQLNKIGQMQLLCGKPDIAMQLHKKAISICQQGKMTNGIATAYSCLGDVYEQMGDNGKSLEYYEKASEIADNNGHQATLSDVLSKVSITGFKQEYQQRARKILKGFKQARQRFNPYEALKMAEAAFQNQQTEHAKELTHKAIEKLSVTNDYLSLGKCMSLLATHCKGHTDNKHIHEWAESALEYFQKAGNYQLAKQIQKQFNLTPKQATAPLVNIPDPNFVRQEDESSDNPLDLPQTDSEIKAELGMIDNMLSKSDLDDLLADDDFDLLGDPDDEKHNSEQIDDTDDEKHNSEQIDDTDDLTGMLDQSDLDDLLGDEDFDLLGGAETNEASDVTKADIDLDDLSDEEFEKLLPEEDDNIDKLLADDDL